MHSRHATLLAALVASLWVSADGFALFGQSLREARAPGALRGRSAPSRPVGEAARLRMSGGSGVTRREVPKDCGIDPVTGEVVAGDPSLILNTNVDLGDKKKQFMAAASKAIAAGLGKPESFVAVCVSDKQDMIWGGEDTACALGCLYSLGSINNENNKKVSADLANLLSEFGVPSDKIYINFFDVPRENCGYKGSTFAG